MEFLKIISDDFSIEIIPLDKISSIKVVMGKLYINGENKHLKVENSEEFLNKYTYFSQVLHNYNDTREDVQAYILRYICLINKDGYAKIIVDRVNMDKYRKL